MTTFADTQIAFQEAVTAESAAQASLKTAQEAHDAALLAASRDGTPPDGKSITSAAAGVATAETFLKMATLRRVDAEAVMNQTEIVELTTQAASLVASHAALVQAARDAKVKAKEAFLAAQAALETVWATESAVSTATHDGHHFDGFVAARAASNPTLAAIPTPDRPKTRLQAQGTNLHRFEVALLGPTGHKANNLSVFG